MLAQAEMLVVIMLDETINPGRQLTAEPTPKVKTMVEAHNVPQ
ncbi:MAG: hypothetical protein FD133_1579 [Erysipelotrichaceae bacterium]|jgi:hypothetical protein|nr:MAG: hypothetical protein FD179_725 [Erysipelotrichaceae bacterium]TXT17026.1 MAG: hypothetical protein FD133_1579 [Erysipelotrichaceae bacterium]